MRRDMNEYMKINGQNDPKPHMPHDNNIYKVFDILLCQI